MKAIAVNEEQGGFQELTGFTRVKGNRALGGNLAQAIADGALAEFWDKLQAIWNSAMNPGPGGYIEGGSEGNPVGGDGSVSIYGLYDSQDAAAFAWSRTFGSLGNTTSKIEYSGLIYSIMIKGQKYFGFTRAVRFPENRKARNFSPSHYDNLHKSTLPPEATIVGQIHLHYAASDPANRKFSEQRGGDRDQHANNPDISFYLLNNDGNLISHVSKEYFVNTPYTQKVGYNFYGFKENYEYEAKDPETGEMINFGTVPYPEITPSVPTIFATFPKLYIDPVSGKPYGLNKKPL